MSRTRASARKAGSAFESLVVAFLADHVDDRIERRARNGSKDRGDVSGLRHMGGRVVVGNAAVMAPAQDGVTVRAYDDGAYRDFGLGGGLFGFGQGLAHERRRGW